MQKCDHLLAFVGCQSLEITYIEKYIYIYITGYKCNNEFTLPFIYIYIHMWCDVYIYMYIDIHIHHIYVNTYIYIGAFAIKDWTWITQPQEKGTASQASQTGLECVHISALVGFIGWVRLRDWNYQQECLEKGWNIYL